MIKSVVRTACDSDLQTIMSLIDSAKAIMRQSGNLHQWSDAYPSEDIVEEDIRNRDCRIILHDGVPVGSFVLKNGPDPAYGTIYEGQWLDDKPYHVIHRVASRKDVHGLFKEILDYCFSISGNIRIDTHKDNSIMRHLLQKNGFFYCGIVRIDNGEERMAYQRIK